LFLNRRRAMRRSGKRVVGERATVNVTVRVRVRAGE
jgi:hypothetical protein